MSDFIDKKKSLEDEVVKELDGWRPAKKAVAYRYLNGQGVTLDTVDKMISDDIRKELATWPSGTVGTGTNAVGGIFIVDKREMQRLPRWLTEYHAIRKKFQEDVLTDRAVNGALWRRVKTLIEQDGIGSWSVLYDRLRGTECD